MTKKLLIVPFVLAIFMFAGCDTTEITYPEATVAEVEAAYADSKSIINNAIENCYYAICDKVAEDETTSSSVSIILDNEVINSNLYSSISGEVKAIYNSNLDNLELILDLTFTGSGTVVTYYGEADLNSLIFSIIQINGYDMTDDLQNLLEDLT